jgi:hypothetical protein
VGATDDPYLGKPVRAAAFFRVRARTPLLRGFGIAGVVETGLGWLVPRLRSRLPAYSYLAVTDTDLHILELRYGAATTVRRMVGRWPIAGVNAERLDNPWSVRVRLGERTVELAATTLSKDASEVVRLLVDLKARDSELGTDR